jgi:hypothetical protein
MKDCMNNVKAHARSLAIVAAADAAMLAACTKPAALSIVAAAAAKPATNTKIVAPGFDAFAADILAAREAADTWEGNAADVLSRSIQFYLDECTVSGLPRDVQTASAIKAAVADCQVFIDAVAYGTYERKTITAYAQGAARAYFHNVSWYASIQNDNGQTDSKGNTRPDYRIPNAKGNVRSGAAESGATTKKVTREALDKILSKALGMMRALTLDDAAADTLDVLMDVLPGFAETAEG